MTRSATAAFAAHVSEKLNGMTGEDVEDLAQGRPIGL